MSSQKSKKDHDFCLFLIFFDLFCSFCRISFTKCPQTENKKEQKRSCRRENRKMSLVFFVIGSPHFRGGVSNFSQSEARKQCFLASDLLKFLTLPRKYRTLLCTRLTLLPYQLQTVQSNSEMQRILQERLVEQVHELDDLISNNKSQLLAELQV